MDDIHEYLLLKGVNAVSIHGGKEQEERNEAIRLFKVCMVHAWCTMIQGCGYCECVFSCACAVECTITQQSPHPTNQKRDTEVAVFLFYCTYRCVRFHLEKFSQQSGRYYL